MLASNNQRMVKIMVSQVACIECGRKGYSDEMKSSMVGHLCARCDNPHIDFSHLVRID